MGDFDKILSLSAPMVVHLPPNIITLLRGLVLIQASLHKPYRSRFTMDTSTNFTLS